MVVGYTGNNVGKILFESYLTPYSTLLLYTHTPGGILGVKYFWNKIKTVKKLE